MANQNYVLKTNGVGADPSGSYTPVSGGWEKTIASGEVTWLPTGPTSGMGLATDNLSGTTVVADTGVAIAVVSEKTAATTGYTTTTNDTYNLDAAGFVDANVVTATSVAIDYLELVVTVNAGSLGVGTFDLSHAKITSISNVGLITFAGTGFFDDAMECTITYKADVSDDGAIYSAPIPVMGVERVTLQAPASTDPEIKARWEWTDDDVAVGTSRTVAWTPFYAAQAADYSGTAFDLNDKARYIRLAVISEDAGVDAVAGDVAAAYYHESTGASAAWAVSNDASNNLDFEDAGDTIDGIGADPS